jgi:hypothetical protein
MKSFISRATTSLLMMTLLLCKLAAGEFVAPTQTILGAEQPVPLGELVFLTVSPIKEKPANLEKVEYQWKVFDGDAEKTNWKADKDGIYFGTGLTPKKMKVFLVATYLFVVKDGDKVKEVAVRTNFLSVVVQLGDGVIQPPQPHQPEEPEVKDGSFGLAKGVYLEARKVRIGAKELAGSFRGIASAVANGTLKDPKAILANLKKSNNSALQAAGIQPERWDPFGEWLEEKLWTLYQDGKLSKPADYAAAFEEIVVGLSAVR